MVMEGTAHIRAVPSISSSGSGAREPLCAVVVRESWGQL